MSLIENGWLRFIESYDTFMFHLKTRADVFSHRHEDDFQPITLDEFRYPIMLYCLHVIGITLIFIGEIIWFHLHRKWCQFYRQRRQMIIDNIMRTARDVLLK